MPELKVYRANPPWPGVLQALVARVVKDGEPTMIAVVGAKKWKDLPVQRPGGKRGYEQRRVMQLALFAKEQGADCVVFARDRDRDTEREQQIEAGIAEAKAQVGPSIVGGIAVEAIEAWILALLGDRESERHSKPKEPLELRGIETTAQKVAVVERSDLSAVPSDAIALQRWLDRAEKAIANASPIP